VIDYKIKFVKVSKERVVTWRKNRVGDVVEGGVVEQKSWCWSVDYLCLVARS
jgi:hypothetical protein